MLGSLIYTHTLVGFADTVHGSLMLGLPGDILLETAASWAVVLVITGIYLWWPRGRRGGVGTWRLALRKRDGSRTPRVFWRDVHAVVGIYVAAVILFFVTSGLPWGEVSGGWLLRPAIATLGIGYPPARVARPTSTLDASRHLAPWSLAEARRPDSRPPSASAHDIGMDAAIHELAARGLHDGYRLSLPVTKDGVYTAFVYPDRPQGQRTIHIDRYTGRVLADVGYRDYGVFGRAIELGVALHMGNYFGLINQLVLLSACLAIVVLVASGAMIWWRRRPAGGFRAPTHAAIRKRWLGAVLLVSCCLYPLAGVSLAAVALGERLWLAGRRARSA